MRLQIDTRGNTRVHTLRSVLSMRGRALHLTCVKSNSRAPRSTKGSLEARVSMGQQPSGGWSGESVQHTPPVQPQAPLDRCFLCSDCAEHTRRSM